MDKQKYSYININDDILTQLKLSSTDLIVNLHVFTMNDQYLSSLYNIKSWKLINTNGQTSIQLDIHNDARLAGYYAGNYKLKYTFNNNIVGLIDDKLSILEISDSRTELKLFSATNSNVVINQIDELSNYNINAINKKIIDVKFDYHLYIVPDLYYNIINYIVDKTNNIIYIKLKDQLNLDIDLFSEACIVYKYADEITVNINLIPSDILSDVNILKQPNFKVKINESKNAETIYKSHNDLILSSSLNAISGLMSNALNNSNIIKLNIDYSDFNNFIYYSNATARLDNFIYKAKLIEDYTNSINQYTALPSSSIILSDIISFQIARNNILTKFDPYESYLYYNSSSNDQIIDYPSTTWPKLTNTYPYVLCSYTSSQFYDWYTEIHDTANMFDLKNEYSLRKILPSYIVDDDRNEDFVKFIDLTGQYFDNIKLYIDKLLPQEIHDSLDIGIAKKLIYESLYSKGWFAGDYSQFTDLWNYSFGLYENDTIKPYKSITEYQIGEIYNNDGTIISINSIDNSIVICSLTDSDSTTFTSASLLYPSTNDNWRLPSSNELKLAYLYAKTNASLVGDFNNDGIVDSQDLALMSDALTRGNTSTDPGWAEDYIYDLNNDNVIDLSDLVLFDNITSNHSLSGFPSSKYWTSEIVDSTHTLAVGVTTFVSIINPTPPPLYIPVYTTGSIDIELNSEYNGVRLVKTIHLPRNPIQIASGSVEDYNYEIWKRILNNLPYLYKTKGTIEGTRALSNCYGVPDTLLRLKEYGGPEKLDVTSRLDYNKYSYLYTFYNNGSSIINYVVAKGFSNIKNIEFRCQIPATGYDTTLLICEYLNLNLSLQADTGYLCNNTIPIISHSLFDDIFNYQIIAQIVGLNVQLFVRVASKYNNIIFKLYEYVINTTIISAGNTDIYWGGYITGTGFSSGFSSGFASVLSNNQYFSGSLSEIKLWTTTTAGLVNFIDRTLSPNSYNGDTNIDSYNNLKGRLPLGGDNIIYQFNSSSINDVINVIPNKNNLSGSFQVITGASGYGFTPLTEISSTKWPDISGNRSVSNKIRIEENYIEGQILSLNKSNEISAYDKYPNDSAKFGAYFSVTNEINQDIAYQMGGVNIDDYIGDWDSNYSSSYFNLQYLNNIYSTKYTNIDVNQYNNLLKYYNHELFTKIEQNSPARTNTITGLVIEPHLLNRSKINIIKSEPVIENNMYEQTIQIYDHSINGELSQYDGTISTPISNIDGVMNSYEANINHTNLTNKYPTQQYGTLNGVPTYFDSDIIKYNDILTPVESYKISPTAKSIELIATNGTGSYITSSCSDYRSTAVGMQRNRYKGCKMFVTGSVYNTLTWTEPGLSAYKIIEQNSVISLNTNQTI